MILRVARIHDRDNGNTGPERQVWFESSVDKPERCKTYTYQDRFELEVGKTYFIDDSWGRPVMENRAEISLLQEQVENLKRTIAKFKRFPEQKDMCHATYNGGHEDEQARKAFHHGMDTVFNVFAHFDLVNGDVDKIEIDKLKHPHDRFDNDDCLKMIDIKRDFNDGQMYDAFHDLLQYVRACRTSALNHALAVDIKTDKLTTS